MRPLITTRDFDPVVEARPLSGTGRTGEQILPAVIHTIQTMTHPAWFAKCDRTERPKT